MTEDSRFCKNCNRDVSAANFSLHEAHCLRFLALCPVCGEQVPQKNMKDHQTEAHKQVRCNLCHQSMQQYQLEHHETKECHKRAMKCKICELEMAFDELEEHLNTCGSRTERCWDCNKFIMYKDQKRHKDTCQAGGLSYLKDVNLQTTEASTDAALIYHTGTGGNLCQKCNKSFPDDQYSQHLNKCSAAHNLTKGLSDQPTSKLSTEPPQASSFLDPSSRSEHAMAWKDVRPKTKEKDQRLTSKMVLKPSKEKIGFPSPARSGLPTSPQALKDIESFDMLVTCAHCNILLPFPTLQNHEIKCLRLTSLRLLEKNRNQAMEKKGSSFPTASRDRYRRLHRTELLSQVHLLQHRMEAEKTVSEDKKRLSTVVLIKSGTRGTSLVRSFSSALAKGNESVIALLTNKRDFLLWIKNDE